MRSMVACLLLMTPIAAQAQGVPENVYFVGRYEVTGRDGKGPVDDVVQLLEQGQTLTVKSCNKGAGEMVVDRSGEGPFATIKLGDWDLECQWFNTWDNYPLLACYDDGRTRLTLWPANQVDGCEGS
jgi:hypothetical protein